MTLLSEISTSIANASFCTEATEILNTERAVNIGCPRFANEPFITALAKNQDANMIIVCNSRREMYEMADEQREWLSQIDRTQLIFPELDLLWFENRHGVNIDSQTRFTTLAEILRNSSPHFIYTTYAAVLQLTISKMKLSQDIYTIKKYDIYKISELARFCTEQGYEIVKSVFDPGQIAIRGSIVDIFSPLYSDPVRLEFFDEELVSIRFFDAASQHSKMEIENVCIVPPKIETDAYVEYFAKRGSSINGNRSLLGSFFSYFTSSTVVVLTDYFEITGNVAQVIKENKEIGRLLNWTNVNFFVDSSDFIEKLNPYKIVKLHEFTTQNRTERQICAPFEMLDGKLLIDDKPIVRLKELLKKYENAIVATEFIIPTKKMLTELELVAKVVNASITRGFTVDLQDGRKITIISDHEIFKIAKRRVHYRGRKTAIESKQKIEIGSYVVHKDYGIAIFRGTKFIEREATEYLVLEYDDNDILYVPIDKIHRVKLYHSFSTAKVKLSSLKSNRWKRVVKVAKESIEQYAAELLMLHGRRAKAVRRNYSGESEWQDLLATSFPYELTPDQEKTIKEIEDEMANTYSPIQRLVCGDVGYGKTEIALRISTRVVEAGRQVAIMVPTTILAEQHYQNFVDRLAPFPVNLQVLSRFTPVALRAKIIQEITEGKMDIVIGTHALIQEKVNFKDLGMVIIDEEHHFGIEQKEYFKRKNVSVDVLLMSATPIPRTLQLSLSKIQDISLITTPPKNLLPITTYVNVRSDEMIKRAIQRELKRKGQIFAVVSKIRSLYNIAEQIKNVIPAARIAIAHGKMLENELSKTIKLFAKHEIDVLVSTPIIESGMDFPNANTILIFEPEMFGLSQMYQLRGRVGRSSEQAYAHLIVPRGTNINIQAKQRFEALVNIASLGAGFNIALRDLEMRGIGQILGKKQSGHIIDIGLELYSELLELTIKRKTGTELKNNQLEKKLCDIQLANYPSYIPLEYIDDLFERLVIYQNLSEIFKLKDLEKLSMGITDRFGKQPVELQNLLYLHKIKIIAFKVDILSIATHEKGYILRFHSNLHLIKNILHEHLQDVFYVSDKHIQIDKEEQGESINPYLYEQIQKIIEVIQDLPESLVPAEQQNRQYLTF